jgi:2,3-bisphosphoglycerate-independent phosphoglycerate mutase
MSAEGIADRVVKAIEDATFDVIIVNFANADMVGHSGKLEPTVKAVETVDACLGRIERAVKARGGAMLITADHGNAEQMIDPGDGWPAHGAHNESGAVYCGRREWREVLARAGRIAARHFSDGARHAGHRRAGRDDGARFARAEEMMPGLRRQFARKQRSN